MKKPIIGIVSKHFSRADGRPNMYIGDEIKQAIFDSGGVAVGVLLPRDERSRVVDCWQHNLTPNEYNSLISQINLCDGILFQGGNACDNYEMIVAKYCYDHNIPTLGICCGQNVMVRALGGTTKKVKNPEKHYTKTKYAHSIKITKNSKFFNIVKTAEMMVNSRHKKTIDKHPSLTAVAYCDDGYIDVVESGEKDFYVAVRFHPESLYRTDRNMDAIFVEFVKSCRAGQRAY